MSPTGSASVSLQVIPFVPGSGKWPRWFASWDPVSDGAFLAPGETYFAHLLNTHFGAPFLTESGGTSRTIVDMWMPHHEVFTNNDTDGVLMWNKLNSQRNPSSQVIIYTPFPGQTFATTTAAQIQSFFQSFSNIVFAGLHIDAGGEPESTPSVSIPQANAYISMLNTQFGTQNWVLDWEDFTQNYQSSTFDHTNITTAQSQALTLSQSVQARPYEQQTMFIHGNDWNSPSAFDNLLFMKGVFDDMHSRAFGTGVKHVNINPLESSVVPVQMFIAYMCFSDGFDLMSIQEIFGGDTTPVTTEAKKSYGSAIGSAALDNPSSGVWRWTRQFTNGTISISTDGTWTTTVP